jgi:hypothetical protein
MAIPITKVPGKYVDFDIMNFKTGRNPNSGGGGSGGGGGTVTVDFSFTWTSPGDPEWTITWPPETDFAVSSPTMVMHDLSIGATTWLWEYYHRYTAEEEWVLFGSSNDQNPEFTVANRFKFKLTINGSISKESAECRRLPPP